MLDRRKLRRRLTYILLFLVFVVIVKRYVVTPACVVGRSMEPTLREGDIRFVNKLAYRFRAPRRGEIVSFRTSNDPPLFFVKRIVGLPGEKIEMRDGRLIVDGERVAEPYVARNETWQMGVVHIEDRCVFVMGDNRSIPMGNQLSAEVALKTVMGPLMGVR